MLKGCQKEMLILQTRDSTLFESAYFILRRQAPPDGRADMVAEANRIIGAVPLRRESNKRRSLPRVFWFLAGAILGAGVVALILL